MASSDGGGGRQTAAVKFSTHHDFIKSEDRVQDSEEIDFEQTSHTEDDSKQLEGGQQTFVEDYSGDPNIAEAVDHNFTDASEHALELSPEQCIQQDLTTFQPGECLWRPPPHQDNDGDSAPKSVQTFRATCNFIARGMGCNLHDSIPAHLRNSTGYSLALLVRLKTLAVKKTYRGRLDDAHAALTRHWQRRQDEEAAQDPAQTKPDIVITVPATIDGQCYVGLIEERIWENRKGLMIIDVRNAWLEKIYGTADEVKAMEAMTQAAQTRAKIRKDRKEKQSTFKNEARRVLLTQPSASADQIFSSMNIDGLTSKQKRGLRGEFEKLKLKLSKNGPVLDHSQAGGSKRRQRDAQGEHPLTGAPAIAPPAVQPCPLPLDLDSMNEKEPQHRFRKKNRHDQNWLDNRMSKLVGAFDLSERQQSRKEKKKMRRNKTRSKVLPSERVDLNSMPTLHDEVQARNMAEVVESAERLSFRPRGESPEGGVNLN